MAEIKTRGREYANAIEALRELDQSWIDCIVSRHNGSEIVKNIVELDLLAARIVRVNRLSILPAVIYSASVYNGAHPADAIADLQTFLECSEEHAYKTLEASQKVRLYCFYQLAKRVRI